MPFFTFFPFVEPLPTVVADATLWGAGVSHVGHADWLYSDKKVVKIGSSNTFYLVNIELITGLNKFNPLEMYEVAGTGSGSSGIATGEYENPCIDPVTGDVYTMWRFTPGDPTVDVSHGFESSDGNTTIITTTVAEMKRGTADAIVGGYTSWIAITKHNANGVLQWAKIPIRGEGPNHPRNLSLSPDGTRLRLVGRWGWGNGGRMHFGWGDTHDISFANGFEPGKIQPYAVDYSPTTGEILQNQHNIITDMGGYRQGFYSLDDAYTGKFFNDAGKSFVVYRNTLSTSINYTHHSGRTEQATSTIAPYATVLATLATDLTFELRYVVRDSSNSIAPDTQMPRWVLPSGGVIQHIKYNGATGVNWGHAGGTWAQTVGGLDLPFAFYDSTGTIQWVKRITGVTTYNEFYTSPYTRTVVVDEANDRIYFTGIRKSAATFGIGEALETTLSAPALTTYWSSYFACIRISNGETVFAKRIDVTASSTEGVIPKSMVMRDGKIRLVISWRVQVDIEGDASVRTSGNYEHGMIEYDLDGNFLSYQTLYIENSPTSGVHPDHQVNGKPLLLF